MPILHIDKRGDQLRRRIVARAGTSRARHKCKAPNAPEEELELFTWILPLASLSVHIVEASLRAVQQAHGCCVQTD